LEQIMAPYLRGSASRAMTMQNQGNEVLQGRDYRSAPEVTPESFTRPSQGKPGAGIDPELLSAYYAQRGGTT
jgi:hypothetical protein